MIIALSTLLGFSVLLNVTMGWYVYKLIRNLLHYEDNFLDLRSKLLEFATHLRAINKVESYYGDQTISALIQHMKKIAQEVENYSKVMVVYEDDLQEEEEENASEETQS